jgi:hypothetical protein
MRPKQLDSKFLLFNAAAALVMLVAGFTFLRMSLFPPQTEVCTARYMTGTLFALERDGQLLTSEELQGRLGGKDHGVVENVSATRLSDGPVKVALAVKLVNGAASALGEKASPGGTSFPWEPRLIKGKTASCLTYSVFLPADFDFNYGGTLPGIFGTSSAKEASDDKVAGFWARVGWLADGEGEVSFSVTGGTELLTSAIGRGQFTLPRGRWFRIEQEVVLNSDVAADGILRLWVDGRQAIEITDLQYRNGPEVTISGVIADVFYGSSEMPSVAANNSAILVSQFELRTD